MDLYYLNSSDLARSDVLLGSLGLIIFELGLPLTCTETDKLLTQMDCRINKLQPLSKFLLHVASYIMLEEREEVFEAYRTRNENFQDGQCCNIAYQNAVLLSCELRVKA